MQCPRARAGAAFSPAWRSERGQADRVVAAGVVAVDVEDLHRVAQLVVVAAGMVAVAGFPGTTAQRPSRRRSCPGATAAATISGTLRKLFRPLESQGLTTSVSPTFSIRTERFDSQVW